MEPFVGQIMLFAGNFAPRGWAKCDGQLLPVAGNEALFSIIGATYGGDGRTNFALPDLRGRAPVHAGHGPGLSSYQIGDKYGVESVTLTEQQIPAHAHVLGAQAAPAKGREATNHYLATAEGPTYLDGPPDTKMGDKAISETGGGQAHDNRAPRLALTYCIALVGIFPPRD